MQSSPMVRALIFLLAGAAAALPAEFAEPGGHGSERSRSISLRKRLHVNPLITEPDTMEIEWGGAFSTGGGFTLPAVIHFTPEGPHTWWGRTEFSAGFDSVASSVDSGHRVTNFSDRVSLAATCVVHDGEKLDFAIAPQVAVLLRGGSGVRVGSTAIARYDAGRSSAGISATWTAATVPDDDNPAGTFDLGAGYGFQLADSGLLHHLTPHVNCVWEKSTGVTRQVSVFEGVEYQVTDNFAIDLLGPAPQCHGRDAGHPDPGGDYRANQAAARPPSLV